jgi:phosphoribosyl 1,2-cyclic phosphodiesterase
MKLYVTALNSGSNGNCFYVGNEREAVLVDAGISCREIEKRMLRLKLSMHKVKAIFISHEHSDHVRGVRVLAKKYKLPVYITPGTLRNSRQLDQEAIYYKTLTPFLEVEVGQLKVTSFPKFHDARDPQSFIIQSDEVRVGVLTDIGAPCEHVISTFQNCHAAFLETNYDPEMLEKGHYPFYLKKRITSGFGHLSNQQALELFTRYRSPYLSHLFLSHISAHNNHPDLLSELFSTHSGNTNIILTSRTSEIPVYEITAG